MDCRPRSVVTGVCQNRLGLRHDFTFFKTWLYLKPGTIVKETQISQTFQLVQLFCAHLQMVAGAILFLIQDELDWGRFVQAYTTNYPQDLRDSRACVRAWIT